MTEHRRRRDWARLAEGSVRRSRMEWQDEGHFVRDLLDGRCCDAERVVLVMDQLNTHSLASLYEAFAPEEARRLAERVEPHHTPKHGSWLNMAEIEFSALGRQCVARRVASHDTLRRHLARWEGQRNAAQATVRWHLTTAQARARLRSLYPSVED